MTTFDPHDHPGPLPPAPEEESLMLLCPCCKAPHTVDLARVARCAQDPTERYVFACDNRSCGRHEDITDEVVGVVRRVREIALDEWLLSTVITHGAHEERAN